MTRGMRLTEAKAYVAGRLGVSVEDLSDPVIMLEVRKERGLGSMTEAGEVTYVGEPLGLEAKFHIAELLDIPINSVDRFRGITESRAAPR